MPAQSNGTVNGNTPGKRKPGRPKGSKGKKRPEGPSLPDCSGEACRCAADCITVCKDLIDRVCKGRCRPDDDDPAA